MDEKPSVDSLKAKITKSKPRKALNLSSRGITVLPSEIAALQPTLQVLNLWFNKLTVLPPEIGQLTLLKRLSIAHNRIEGIPAEIASLVNLRKLDAGQNKLASIPEEIGCLTGLRLLGLEMNNIKSLPRSLGNLSCLRNLFLERNEIETLPLEVSNLSSLRKLSLSHNNLSELHPASISGLTNLVELLITDNKLKTVPPEVGRCLSSLSTLALARNDLQWLPEEIGLFRASTLTMLNLSENPALTSLPLSFTRLTALDPYSSISWIPSLDAVASEEDEKAKLGFRLRPNSLLDICCQTVCKVRKHNEREKKEEAEYGENEIFAAVLSPHDEIEKEGDDVSKILSGEWEILPSGRCHIKKQSQQQEEEEGEKQIENEREKGKESGKEGGWGATLPVEVEEKLATGGRRCDGCGGIYFGGPAISGVVAGVVAKTKVWLNVAYCSTDCSAGIQQQNNLKKNNNNYNNEKRETKENGVHKNKNIERKKARRET